MVDDDTAGLQRSGDRLAQRAEHVVDRLVSQQGIEELVELVLAVPGAQSKGDPSDPGHVEQRHRTDLHPCGRAVGSQQLEHHRDALAGTIDLVDLRDGLGRSLEVRAGPGTEPCFGQDLLGAPAEQPLDRAARVQHGPVDIDDHESIRGHVDDHPEGGVGQLPAPVGTKDDIGSNG